MTGKGLLHALIVRSYLANIFGAAASAAKPLYETASGGLAFLRRNVTKVRVDYAFLTLSLLLIVINYPYFSPAQFVSDDTKAKFEVFYHFYNELFFNSQLAHWLPYGGYGLPGSIVHVVNLTPGCYVAALAGALLRAENVLLVFKLSVLFDQFVFLTGMYVLSRLLFSRTSTVFFVSLSAIASTVWHVQVYYNFSIYYLFPWALSCLILFYRTHRPAFVWLTGIIVVVWLNGNVPYFLPLWIFVFFLIALVLFPGEKGAVRSLFERSWSNVSFFLAFLAVLGFFACHVLYSLNAVDLIAPLRDAATGKNSLNVFLNYHGQAVLQGAVDSLFLGEGLLLKYTADGISTAYTHTYNNTFYIGFLPLVFFAWAVMNTRGRTLYALLAAAAALFWLSFGGLFARIIYYFPGMAYFRCISIVYGLIKILVALGAGFGLEHFLGKEAHRRPAGIFLIVALFVFILDINGTNVAGLFSPGVFSFSGVFADVSSVQYRLFVNAIAVAILAGVGALAVLSRLRGSELVRGPVAETITKGALLLVLFLDLLSYQMHARESYPALPASHRQYLDAVAAHPLEFQQERRDAPLPGTRQHRALELATNPYARGKYVNVNYFAQFDPYETKYRKDLLSRDMSRLLAVKPENEQVVSRILGYRSPKMRLVPGAIFAGDPGLETVAVRDLADPGTTVVLSGDERGGDPVPPPGRRGGAGSATVTKFTSNEVVVEADVKTSPGAWLVYSDAFHPQWQAVVNGTRVPVRRAYVALKAVYLESGKSLVRFTFHNWFDHAVAWLNGVAGMGFVLMFLFVLSGAFPFAFFLEGKDPGRIGKKE